MQFRIWIAALAVVLLCGCAKEQGGVSKGAVSAAAVDTRIATGFPASPAAHPKASLLKTPLYFEPNVGQISPEARFVARGPGFNLFLTQAGAVFHLTAHPACSGRDCAARTGGASDVVRMAFAGANPAPTIDGFEPQKARSHYFIGNDPAGWHRNVGRYAKVRYRGLYPGVDAVFYGNSQALEYDFVVAPGANTGAIAFDLDGVNSVRIDGAGNLVMRTPHGALQQHKPVVYQQVGGRRVPVEGRYALLGGTRVGFRIGRHDTTAPLVIDPMFGFSKYLGGSAEDKANAVAVDAEGSTYVVGTTDSMDMVPGEVHETVYRIAFVTKFDVAGNVSYTTYLGGTSGDAGGSVAVDATGRVYVAGETWSRDFPVVNAAQDQLHGNNDAFVARLTADGSALDYSTFVGGSGYEPSGGYDYFTGPAPTTHLAVDGSGSAYITGGTTSSDFPVVNAFQSALAVEPGNGGYTDAFVAKLSEDGRRFVYATYLGGTRDDVSNGIGVDANGNAYLVGRTASPNFPVASAMQGMLGSEDYDDAFVAELSADGRSLVYSTLLGGIFSDRATAVAVDGEGNAYVSGFTESPEFPFSVFPTDCPGRNQPPYAFKTFVAKVAALGQGLAYSACIKSAQPNAIALDASENVYLTGFTGRNDFPTVVPMQAQLNLEDDQPMDAFVAKLAAGGEALLFSTYIGGNYRDTGNGVAIDANGTIHVVGDTAATDFPTTDGSVSADNPYQLPDTTSNGFVATIQDGVELSIADFHIVEGDGPHAASFTVHLSSPSPDPVTFDLDTMDFAPAAWAATEGSDYEALHARGLVFAPGETNRTVTMTVYGDTTPESGAPSYLAYPGESFMVMPSNVVGAVLRDEAAVGTIGNDDAVLWLSGMGGPEGRSGESGSVTMLIRLLARVVVPVSFDYTVAPGSATNNVDYLATPSGHVTLEPGQEGWGPGITVLGDDVVEPNETVQVRFFNVEGATPGQSTGTLTILNDDTTLSVADAAVVEGNSGTKMAQFVVSLAQPTVTPVSFNVVTKNGTAAAGSDYTGISLSDVSIPAGSTSTLVAVPITGDTAVEGNETFQVLVSNVIGAALADGTATGTIRNDDTKLSIADVSVTEGNSGTKSATFTVKLTNASASTVTFNIATANKTAVAGSDYTGRSLSGQSIAAGSTSRTFTVSITGDRSVEANETFVVNVSGVKGATVTDSQAVGTIRNDDAVLSITDASVSEGNSSTKTLSFTVKLSAASASPVTFNIATANKTALAGSDYLALSLTGQSIPAGSTSKVFKVTVKGDTVRESSETFVVNVGSVSGATVGDAQGLGTIVNDD